MPRFNLLLVSNATNATNQNSTNSAFTIVLNQPTIVPNHAKNILLSCVQANIVNFFHNISAALGNNIIYYTDDSANPTKYTITFPDGSFDFADINTVLKTFFTVRGIDVTTIKFYSQTFTQKISVALKPGFGIRIPAGMATILGYADNSTYFNSATFYSYYDAVTTAKFNKIISLNLLCNLANSNFFNGQYSNLLATIPITASIGNIINYSPYVPIKIDSPNLAGQVVDHIEVRLYDQLNRGVVIDEDWNATITIEWEE